MDTLTAFVDDVNRSGGTYHKIDFGNGLVMDGEYDMREYWPRYGFPEPLAGQTVLDVGTASGFFALEFARRGARAVTATDIGDGAFQRSVFSHAADRIRYVQKDLFDFDDQFGKFDLVFCGSLLLHIWDQFGALQRLRSVCGGMAIVATGTMSPDRGCQFPAAELVGQSAVGGNGIYWTTWFPNGQALTRMMLAAGFARAEYQGDFRLRSAAGKHNFDTPHGVVHGWIE